MLTLLLAEAELERIPPALHGHQQVVSAARHAGVRAPRMLLDSSLHHSAMRKHELPEAERRGRPDLVHFFLLTALESPLNQAGGLRVLVHTRNDELIRVDPTTRLVRNYNRFCGLIQQLFDDGAVPHDKRLLTLERNFPLTDVLRKEKAERVLLLDEEATPRRPWEVFTSADAQRHVLCIIGGFPSGRLRTQLEGVERVGLGSRPLTVWTVASELLAHYERVALDRLEAAGSGAPAPGHEGERQTGQ